MTADQLNLATLIQNRIVQLKEQKQIWEQGKILSINLLTQDGKQNSINLKNVEQGTLKTQVIKNIDDKIASAYKEIEAI